MRNVMNIVQSCKIFRILDIALFTSIMILIGLSSGFATETDNPAFNAYQLRLDGKAGDAKALLEEHLAANPDDAAANYELCRTYLYIMTGNPRESQGLLENANSCIDKAIKLDPENIAYNNFSARVAFLKAYMALQSGAENGGELITALCEKNKSILEMQPDYWLASLNLVEIFSSVPPEMGGDPVTAEQYVKSLEQYDEVIGAKARALVMPEDADYIEFWKEVLDKHPGDARVLEELGKTYFKIQDGEEGTKYLRQAITFDPGLSYLHLDIARYYLYSIMSDKSAVETYLPLFETAVNDFFATVPNASLKAWATGWLGRIKSNAGNKEEGENLLKQAETIDPYYSKATAIPSQDLFIPPDEVPYYHSYMFQPF